MTAYQDAQRKAADERAKKAWAMYVDEDLTYAEIGRRLGIGGERARRIVQRAHRLMSRLDPMIRSGIDHPDNPNYFPFERLHLLDWETFRAKFNITD